MNSTGVSEPVVQTQGTDRIVVELPGVSDADEIKRLLGTTGKLSSSRCPPTSTERPPQARCRPCTASRCRPRSAPLRWHQIDQAYVRRTTGANAVGFRLKGEGRAVRRLHAAHVGEFFAIVLDGQVVSAPSIESAITGSRGSSRGSTGFTATEMTDLITVLNYGSLPFPLQLESQSSIGATLAGFSLNRILLAALIAVALVFLFMIIYYRLPGVSRVGRPGLLRAGGARHLPPDTGDPHARGHRRVRPLDRHGGATPTS